MSKLPPPPASPIASRIKRNARVTAPASKLLPPSASPSASRVKRGARATAPNEVVKALPPSVSASPIASRVKTKKACSTGHYRFSPSISTKWLQLQVNHVLRSSSLTISPQALDWDWQRRVYLREGAIHEHEQRTVGSQEAEVMLQFYHRLSQATCGHGPSEVRQGCGPKPIILLTALRGNCSSGALTHTRRLVRQCTYNVSWPRLEGQLHYSSNDYINDSPQLCRVEQVYCA